MILNGNLIHICAFEISIMLLCVNFEQLSDSFGIQNCQTYNVKGKKLISQLLYYGGSCKCSIARSRETDSPNREFSETTQSKVILRYGLGYLWIILEKNFQIWDVFKWCPVIWWNMSRYRQMSGARVPRVPVGLPLGQCASFLCGSMWINVMSKHDTLWNF